MFGQDDQFIYNGFHEAKLHLDGIAENHVIYLQDGAEF
jgi:hypothetical protein